MRKLVTVRQVSSVDPIPGADLIECITVEGWKLVSAKGNFQPGDLCVYFEIDSFLPDGNPLWQDLVNKSPREFEGRRGHALRTIKLRGQISQGFAIPVREFKTEPESTTSSGNQVQDALDDLSFVLGKEVAIQEIRQMDFAELLGVVKYEKPIPACLNGLMDGNFPSFIRKTDQERCQNIPELFDDLTAEYEVTLKLDGTSITIYSYDDHVGVCGRNFEFKLCEENYENSYVRAALDSGLLDFIKNFERNIAFQGELMGPGIQGNRESLSKAEIFIFDIFDIDRGTYLTPSERMDLLKEIPKIKHVPVLHESFSLGQLDRFDLDCLLTMANGPSLNNKVREGIVFKRLDGQFSFKAINNKFLLTEK